MLFFKMKKSNLARGDNKNLARCVTIAVAQGAKKMFPVEFYHKIIFKCLPLCEFVLIIQAN